MRKIFIALALVLTIMLACISTASATYYGWWNNSLKFTNVGSVSKGGYVLPSTTGGFLGTFSSTLQNGQFHATMSYNDIQGYHAVGNWSISCSTGTWVEKTATIVSGKTYSYQFYCTPSNVTQTVVANDAGYFYDA